VVANEYINKWYLFLDSIFKNRTDGALVRLSAGVNELEGIQAADAKIIGFMRESKAELNKFIVN